MGCAYMPALNSDYLTRGALEALGFRRLGENVLVHSTAVLTFCEKISLGSNIRIDPYVVISASGDVVIGDNVHLAAHCNLSGRSVIELADFCGLSNGVYVFSSSDDYKGHALSNPTVPASYRAVECASVRIGRHVVVGAGTVILPGADLCDGVAVGALSLVNRRLDSWTIYAGVPVRRLRNRSREILSLEERYFASIRVVA